MHAGDARGFRACVRTGSALMLRNYAVHNRAALVETLHDLVLEHDGHQLTTKVGRGDSVLRRRSYKSRTD
jgi:hypothetical protein